MNNQSTAYLLDGDIASRRYFENLLISAGYNVKTFASFKEFVDVLESDISGFIIIDIGMLSISGVEFVNMLENQGINAPIIVLSADNDTCSMKKAKELEAVSFFRKPVDGTALLDAIEWTLKTNNFNGSRGNT